MKLFIALIAGLLFGGGLVVSGMTNTAKVQGWLDVFGAPALRCGSNVATLLLVCVMLHCTMLCCTAQ